MPEPSSPRNRSDQRSIGGFGFQKVRVWAIGKNGPSNQTVLQRTLRSRSIQKATELIYRRRTQCCVRLLSPQSRFLPDPNMDMWDYYNTATAEIRGISKALGRDTDGLKLEYSF